MESIAQVSISHVAAQRLVNRAVELAAAQKMHISACVVDIHGRVKAKVVMDNAPVIADALVEKKARTALLGIASQAFADAVADQPVISHSMLQLEPMTLLGGGYPLFDGDQLIGGFAVGGGTVDQDIQCAEAVLAAEQ